MNPTDAQEFYRLIEKNRQDRQFAPVYLLYGEEEFLRTQALNYLRTSVMDGSGDLSDFNYAQFDGTDCDVRRLREEIETFPMMRDKRMVVVKNIEAMKEAQWTDLLDLFENPATSTVLALVGETLDKRKKIFKVLQENAFHVEFKRPFENQIPSWIRRLATTQSMELSEEAMILMHKLIGNSLSEIHSELLKLKEYLSEKFREATTIRVELEDVAAVVVKRRQEDVFEFIETVGHNDRAQALIQLAELLEQGQSEVGLVSLIARHLRILQAIKWGQAQGSTGARLAQLAQVPPYFLGEYVNQSKNWNLKKIENGLLSLAMTDKALKSAPGSPGIWLENMVLQLTANT